MSDRLSSPAMCQVLCYYKQQWVWIDAHADWTVNMHGNMLCVTEHH